MIVSLGRTEKCMLNSSGLDHNLSENLQKNHKSLNILPFDKQTCTNTHEQKP